MIMNLKSKFHSRGQQGSAMLGYLFVALITVATLAAIAGLVVQNLNYGQRRQDLINAVQYAQGGATLCAADVEQSFTNGGAGFLTNLTHLAYPYTKNDNLSTSTQWVYERTVTRSEEHTSEVQS